MAEVDYGYGDSAPDYGYGDASPDQDYGYGDAKPDEDYGYGDAAPDQDYGYGDAAPDQDYGYGDAAPDEAPPKRKPKRRCSVTKFSLDAEAQATQNCIAQIDAFRNGAAVQTSQAVEVPPAEDEKSVARTASCNSSADGISNDGEEPIEAEEKMKEQQKKVKKSMMRKIGRRLSVFR